MTGSQATADATSAGPKSGPLAGIRVIDLTMWFQGPVAAQWLADFGAEVIHLERPQGGDLARGVRSLRAVPVGDWNQYFLVINRNKKSMAVDLSAPEGREVVRRLVKEADVFLTNLTADNLRKWQLAYDDLKEINTGLVYATASGFGHFGEVNRPSFDLTVQALTGIMSRLGEPGQPPIYTGMGSGDAMGGLMAALGIMAALSARQRTGRGQLVDASLYGAQLFMAAPTFLRYLAGDEDMARQRSRTAPENPLWNTYLARDRWLFLCLPNTADGWRLLCRGLGDEAVERDRRFDSPSKRRSHAPELVAAIDAIIAGSTATEWIARWRPLGIPASPVNTFADLVEDPQAWDNGYLTKTHCAEVNREVTVRGFPIGLSKTPGALRSLGPELGQHTEEVLVEILGDSWEDVASLKEAGAIL